MSTVRNRTPAERAELQRKLHELRRELAESSDLTSKELQEQNKKRENEIYRNARIQDRLNQATASITAESSRSENKKQTENLAKTRELLVEAEKSQEPTKLIVEEELQNPTKRKQKISNDIQPKRNPPKRSNVPPDKYLHQQNQIAEYKEQHHRNTCKPGFATVIAGCSTAVSLAGFIGATTLAASGVGLSTFTAGMSASTSLFFTVCAAVPVYGWAILLAASVIALSCAAYKYYSNRKHNLMLFQYDELMHKTAATNKWEREQAALPLLK